MDQCPGPKYKPSRHSQLIAWLAIAIAAPKQAIDNAQHRTTDPHCGRQEVPSRKTARSFHQHTIVDHSTPW